MDIIYVRIVTKLIQLNKMKTKMKYEKPISDKAITEQEWTPQNPAIALALQILSLPSLAGDDEKTKQIRRDIIETISKHNA